MGRWAPAPDENCYGVAIFEYDGQLDSQHCLSLELGERVYIYEECDGWYRGCSTGNQSLKGIFPKSYVKIKPSVKEVIGNTITIIPIEDPITEEAKSVLREWHDLWKDLFTAPYKDSLSSNYKANIDLFSAIKCIMSDIIKCLSSSYLGVLGQNQLEEKKMKITQSIDHGNMLLQLDLVPRDEQGNKVNPITCSERTPDQKGVLELYNIHKRVNEQRSHKGSDAVRTNEPVHLFLGICQCVLLHQTPLEVYASLYDYDENKMISERFLAPLTKNGLPEDRERLNDISTVFTDISRDDLARLFIVIRYYKRGPIKQDSSNSKNNSHNVEYLRPLGVSYVCVKNYMDTMEKVGLPSDNKINHLHIYTLGKDKNESNFSELHRKAIAGEKAHFQLLDSTQGLYISNIKIFTGTLDQVRQQNPHIFNRPSITKENLITRKLGFPAVINPTDQRNDLYITLKRAKFKKGDKKQERNVLVNVCVKDSQGRRVEGCISRGTGEPTVDQYQSSVIYHCNTPTWDETFRINLPDHGSYSFANCHILFTFRHANNKAHNKDKPGFSFLKLANDDGTLIQNDNHKLVVYKDTAKTSEFRHPTSEYIQLDSYFGISNISKDTKITSKIEQKSSEFLEISTVFCSSKFTQNSDLKSLLQWGEHQGRLGQILQKVQMIQGEELVKFLHQIFEALFMILENKDAEFGEVVFDCIVFIICTLADHKFEHFRPVLDDYIATYFFHTQVYIKLLDRLRSKVEQYESSKNIGDIMKALEYLFKFIVQSSHLHSKASTIDRSFNKFQNSLLGFFDKLNSMIKGHPNRLTTAKTLKYFPHTIPELNKILCLETTCQIISNFIDAVPNMDEKEIIRYKLACISDLVKGHILDDPRGCELLIPLLMKHLKLHLKDEETNRDNEEVKKEKRQAIEILTHILVTVSNKHSNTAIVKKIVDPLLELLFRLVCQVDKVNDLDLAQDYVSCLIALLHLMNDEHYTSFMEPLTEHNLIDFLNDVFLVFKDLMRSNVYPDMWIVMSMLQSYVVLNAIIYFSKALAKIPPGSLVNGPQDYMGKKKQLWENFFYLCVGFITQDTLQLEEFREAKRKKIAAQYGDMRSEMCQEMINMFNKLGDNKEQFLPEIVGPFLQVTLVPLDSLRREIIPIFFDMIECYHRHHTNFDIVEREVIDKLDVLISNGKGDTKYSLLMYETLLKKFGSPNIDRSLHQNGVRFVNSVKGILDHLLNFREVREGDHHSEARMLCTVNLLNFYEELGRDEMSRRYIWKLYTSHLAQKNYVEAAFTLEMYGTKLKFSVDDYVPKFEDLPRERQRERKARLFDRIIRHYETGESYENTFRFFKDLCDYYEGMFDYKCLAGTLQRQAAAYTKILDADRLALDYFYVGFYGQAFPAFLRNKRFIYCGRKLDRLSSVTLRFQEQFPRATLLNFTSEPTVEITTEMEQYLQIYKVTCVMEERPEFAGRDVPSLISKFYDTSEISCFSYDRRFNKKGGKTKDDDFANTWLEKTKFYTVHPLPGKLRLAEIAHQEITEISPLNTAIETMEKKNRELRILIDSYRSKKDQNANPLTMILNGTVDAVVMGGIKKYEEAFFNVDYFRNNPGDGDSILYLKRVIIDQVDILQDGIDLHGRICPENVRPLHEHIMEQYDKMRQDTSCYRRELGIITPGTPGYRNSLRTSTINSSSSLNRYNSTLSRNMRSRTSMISVASAEDSSASITAGSATPPPLPSRGREVLPDPAALIRERRSNAAAAPPPDQPALPPKKRSSVIQNSPTIGGSPLAARDSSRSINSNGSFDMSFSNNSISDEAQNAVPTLPPRPRGGATPPDTGNILTDEAGETPPPLPQRANSTAGRPPKVPRDKTVPLPNL